MADVLKPTVMKNILASLGIIIVSLSITAASNAAPAECDNAILYQPGGSTLLDASYSFATELQALLDSCEVQKLVDTKGANFYIESFVKEDGRQTLKYKKIVFEDGHEAKELSCVFTQTQTPIKMTPSTTPMPAIGQIEIKNTNTCIDASNPKNFVCKKGWIDCMPGGPAEEAKYCSKEYEQWAKENCGGAPNIAQ